jgi:hypothetical protein
METTPDPSALTTQMTWREIGSLKELVFSELNGLKKGIEVAHEDLVRVPTDVQKQVGTTRELLTERIDGISKVVALHVSHLEKQFDIIERQRIEQKNDTRQAVDDALKAAKEIFSQQNQANNLANAKSEASFSKQIDQQAERINDMKERLAKAEGRGGGLKDLGGWIFGAIAILFYLLNYLK